MRLLNNSCKFSGEEKKKKVKNKKYEVVTCTVHVVKMEHNTNKTTQSKLRYTLKDLSWVPKKVESTL